MTTDKQDSAPTNRDMALCEEALAAEIAHTKQLQAELDRLKASAPTGAPSDDDLILMAVDHLHVDDDRMPHGVVTFARAVLARYGARAVPDGWRLVPEEPTPEWVSALGEAGVRIGAIEHVVHDVLAAAPQPPAAQPDPCPQCIPGGVCKTPTCGRLAAAQAVPDERAAFEAWQSSKGYKRPDDPGEWEAWQARAALAAPQPAAHISDDDRMQLAGALGLMRGHRYTACADALQRVLDADAARQPAAQPQPSGNAPSVEDAHSMGATGGPAPESERLAFEAWMQGHCWALCSAWNGKQYVSNAEQGGDVDPRAMMTRRLWAAWRDRAALAAQPSGQAGERRDSGSRE